MKPTLTNDDATVAVLAEVTSKRREHDAIMRTMGENAFTLFLMLFAFSCIVMNRYVAAVVAIIIITADSIFTNVLRAHLLDLNRAILDGFTKALNARIPPTEGEDWHHDNP